MTNEDYSLCLARKHTREFEERDSIISRHHEAMECRDCEDFLESGIKAYQWIKRSDHILRQAAIEGFEVPTEARDAIAELYHAWLHPCRHAEAMIRQHTERGFRIKNLNEFRAACKYVQRQVRFLDMETDLDDAFQGGVFDEAFWQEAHDKRSS